MNLDDAKSLKHVSNETDHSITTLYRYKEFIPDTSLTCCMYYPRCIIKHNEKLYLVDFSKTAEKYLKQHITSSTSGLTFVSIEQTPTILHHLCNITLDQAQEIIDRNIKLFKQIQVKAKENDLIDQINEL